MFNTIWEFFFCPQHGVVMQCMPMIPALLTTAGMYVRRVVCWKRRKED